MPNLDLSIDRLVHPNYEFAKNVYISTMSDYHRLYRASIEDPVQFWHDMCQNLFWKVPPQRESFLECNFDLNKGPINIKWMQGAETNMCYNLLDRHVDAGLGDHVAYFWCRATLVRVCIHINSFSFLGKATK